MVIAFCQYDPDTAVGGKMRSCNRICGRLLPRKLSYQ